MMYFNSTAGGSVTTPGEGSFPNTCCEDARSIVATPDGGCSFVEWTCVDYFVGNCTCYISDPYSASTTIDLRPLQGPGITAHFSCPPGGNLTGSEWWVYHVYYNSEEGTTNSNYHIMNVRNGSIGTHTTVYDDCGQRDANGDGSGLTQTLATDTGGSCPCNDDDVCRDPTGFSNWDWTGAVIDHSMPHTGTGSSSPRHRRAPYGFTGTMVPATVNREIIDMEWGVKHNSAITQTDTYQIPRAFDMTANNGMAPSNVQYSYQDQTNAANTGTKPAGRDGYPFTVNSSLRQSWQFTYFDNRYMGSTSPTPALFEKGHIWQTGSFVQDYDVDANCNASDTTTDTFDVYRILRNPDYYARCAVGGAGVFTPPTGGVSFTTNQSVNTWFYWNDSVKNFVRLLDRDTYYGYEDWGIKAWESRRTKVTINEFSDAGTGFDINVTVENNCQTGAAGNFGVLALIMDMNAVTATNSVPYVNGKTVYPDVSSWSSIAGAIQYTGTLAYGESATLTWSNVGTSDTSHTYELWVNGAAAQLTGTP